MTRRMHIIVIILFCATSAGSQAQAETWRQVITAQDIQRAGLVRLSDLYLLVDTWDAVSLDGFTWQAAPLGLTPGSSVPVILIDGQPVLGDPLAGLTLNALPLSVSDIDSVEIFTAPVLVNGCFSDAGLLHIHTRSAPPGVSLQGRYTVGQETGDPGPYRYTEFASANVDRIGADQSYGLSYGSDRFDIRGGFLRQDHYLSDPAMLARCSTINFNQNPKMEMRSQFAAASLHTTSWENRLLFGSTNFSRFLFHPPDGREIPTDDDLLILGLSGDVALTPTSSFQYTLQGQRRELDERANSAGLNFDWRQDIYRGHVEYRRRVGAVDAGIGLNLIRTETQSPYLPGDEVFDQADVYTTAAIPLSDRGNLQAALRAKSVDDETGFDALLRSGWQLTGRQRLTLGLAYAQILPPEQADIWTWRAWGYTFDGLYASAAGIQNPVNRLERLTAGLAWDMALRPDLKVEAGLTWRSMRGLTIVDQAAYPDPSLQALTTEAGLIPDVAGQSINLTGAVTWQSLPSLQHSWFAGVSSAVSGDDPFQDAFRAEPATRLSYTVRFSPPVTVSAWGKVTYLSAREWTAYDGIGDQTGEAYSSDIEDALLVDLALTNAFWQRRICASLIFRNLLNEESRCHPLGAAFDLTYFIQLDFTFDSLWQP